MTNAKCRILDEKLIFNFSAAIADGTGAILP